MDSTKILMLTLLGDLVVDLLNKVVQKKIKSCSTVTYLGEKKYRLTLEEVANDTEV